MPFLNCMHKRARRARWLLRAHGLGLSAVLASTALVACQGCRTTTGGANGSAASASGSGSGAADGSVRIYLLSDVAGALEPCGCTKDQLGGLDHAAAWIHAQDRASASGASLLVSAGPLFFMEPKLSGDHRDQDVAKAETIATSLKSLGFTAFTPGANEWAAGGTELGKLVAQSGGHMLVANATVAADAGEGAPPLDGWTVTSAGGVTVGIVGVTRADQSPGSAAPLTTTPPVDAITRGIAALKASGAQVFIALAALGRGEAKRLADAVPTLTAVVVGSPGGSGDVNTPAPPPERLGDVLILQTGNHLTTVGALDLVVRRGSVAFADGTGLELGQKREEKRARVDELRNRIALWEHDPAIKKEDLDARRAELAKVEGELASLDVHPVPPEGSYFRYTTEEIRDKLGSDPAVKSAELAYYKQINDHNRVALADRMPRPAVPGEPTYMGIDACANKCHKDAREVWEGTRHAKAYATLADENKQFNLDCVSCHVTGYDQPGGSSVTHVDGLKDVECEVCHGPGSKHAADPKHVKTLVAKPKADGCISACHHPPHVEGFDAEKRMADILGPGHGL